MQVAEANIRECAQSYEAILFTTEKKLAEIEIYKQQELKRLSTAFQEIREAIFQREKTIKKELIDKMTHA